MNIYLASSSPRRKTLLESAGYRVHVLAAPVDESRLMGESPRLLAKRLAEQKVKAAQALAVEDWPIIGADTVVAMGDRIFEKPIDIPDAARILTELSGQQHEVITGYCVMRGKMLHTQAVTTTVFFRHLSKETIVRYVGTEEPLGKAGAYAIQGEGATLVKEIRGSLTNVIGLPLAEIIACLQ